MFAVLAAFKKCHAPAIGMVIRAPAALRKAREAEHHVSRRVAVHTEQLTHELIIAAARCYSML